MHSDAVQFVIDVLSLHFVLLGGCVFTVIVGLIERFFLKDQIPLKAYAAVIGLLLLFACYQAWQREHQSKIGRELDLHRQESETNRQVQVVESCGRSLRIAQDALVRNTGIVDTKGDQLRSQQSTIDSCLLQLGKVQQEETQPLRILPYSIGLISNYDRPSPAAKNRGTYLVLSNKTITPIKLLVTCDGDIQAAAGGILGANMYSGGGWGGRVTRSTKQFGVGILTPAWTPTNPLLVTIYSNQDPGNCSFDEQ